MTILHSYSNGNKKANIYSTQMGFIVELILDGKVVSKQMSQDEMFCEQLAEDFTEGDNPEFLSE